MFAELDRVPGPGRSDSPAVEDDEGAERRSRARRRRLTRLADRLEVEGVERGAADERTVDVRLLEQERRAFSGFTEPP